VKPFIYACCGGWPSGIVVVAESFAVNMLLLAKLSALEAIAEEKLK